MTAPLEIRGRGDRATPFARFARWTDECVRPYVSFLYLRGEG